MHYKKGKNRDQIFMTSLGQLVEKDSWARIVDLFVDALPVNELGFSNSKLNKEGNLPYHPSDLFKLLLYGYRNGIRSANKLSKSCTINVEVMWLLKGLRPSPRTINYFRSNNTEAIEKAHRHFVKLLKSWQLLDGKTIALDGTKVRGQNSLKNNFNAKKIERHLDYIEGKIGSYLDQLAELDSDEPSRRARKQIVELEQKIKDLEKRRTSHEELAEQVVQSIDGQVSLSDPDARAVIKSRNIVEVGYNIQATADAKHNLVVDVFAGGVNDLYELGRAAKRAQDISGVKKIDMLADKGYHNGVELAAAERMGVRPFVAIKSNRPQKEPGFRKSDFYYDNKKNAYKCPAGNYLNHEISFKRGSTKKPYKVKRYGTKACSNCAWREKCTTSKHGRKIERPIHQPYIDRNNKRVTRYKDFYRTRQEIIEHVFGTWKRHWGMTHAVVKGKAKVETEYRLAALCYNLVRSLSILGETVLKKHLETLIVLIVRAIGLISSIYMLPNYENRLTYLNNHRGRKRPKLASFN